jgi:hypothetical protein
VKRWQAPLAASPLIVMILAAVGCAIGIGAGLLTSDQIFLSQPAAKAWVVLLGANVAMWFVLFMPTIQRFLAIEVIAVGRRIELVLTLGVFATLFIVPLLPPVAKWISGVQPATGDYPVLLIGGLVAGIPMAGIWRINAVTRQLHPDGRGGDPPARSATLYLTLQDHLQAFLWIVGLVISLGTLALGFAAQALTQDPRFPDVPSHTVWAYGLYYTALLALSYGPTHVALTSVGGSIRDTILGAMPVDQTEVEAWLRRRTELGGLLLLSQGPLSEIKAAILVVSPLLTSLLSTAIKAPS